MGVERHKKGFIEKKVSKWVIWRECVWLSVCLCVYVCVFVYVCMDFSVVADSEILSLSTQTYHHRSAYLVFFFYQCLTDANRSGNMLWLSSVIKVQSYRATVRATVDNLSLVKDHRRVGCNRDEGGLCIGKASIDFSTFQRLKSRVRVWVQVWGYTAIWYGKLRGWCNMHWMCRYYVDLGRVEFGR